MLYTEQPVDSRVVLLKPELLYVFSVLVRQLNGEQCKKKKELSLR